MMWYQIKDKSYYLTIKVKPNSNKTRIQGVVPYASKQNPQHTAQALLVDIAAQPEDNKANIELIKFLAKQLGISSKLLSIKSGKSSRLKTIVVAVSEGLDEKLNHWARS